MIVQEICAEEYVKSSPRLVYSSAEFNELNAYKVDSVRYFLFRDTKVRFMLCVGEKDGRIECPFSAPFGSVVCLKKDWEVSQLEEAVGCLDELAQNRKWRSIKIVLPPAFYDGNLTAAMQNVLLGKGFQIKWIDLNYQLDLRKIHSTGYLEILPYNGRKNYAIAMKSGLKMLYCESIDEIEKAYGIIAANRNAKGYPLRMSFGQVRDTISVVPHDFFIVKKEEVGIAAAQVFHVADGIAQVIYWGDVPGYSNTKPMNYLASQLIEFYGERGFSYLDIGPSTEMGVLNYGLCSFKSSIGCDISAKTTLEKIYDVGSS